MKAIAIRISIDRKMCLSYFRWFSKHVCVISLPHSTIRNRKYASHYFYRYVERTHVQILSRFCLLHFPHTLAMHIIRGRRSSRESGGIQHQLLLYNRCSYRLSAYWTRTLIHLISAVLLSRLSLFVDRFGKIAVVLMNF